MNIGNLLAMAKPEDIAVSSGRSLIHLSLKSTSQGSLTKDEERAIGVLNILHTISIVPLVEKGTVEFKLDQE